MDRIAMPPLHMPHLNTALDDHDEYMRSPSSNNISVDGRLPQSKKAMLLMSPACNFEAFSLHFHLPLKAAAEKFGVRATAFKKRCRSIGIRHWPYRKVRSLKRSLQELNRCKDQGALNDKQQYQYATFKKQLDKLMAPETYGIDPSGRIPMHHFEDDDDEDDSGDDDSYTSSQSPRYGSASFSDCNISPAEADKTFGDFSGPTHLRSIRKQQSSFMSSPHMMKSMPYSSELPSMSHRKDTMMQQQAPYKYPYGGYDHYLHDASAMDKHGLMRAIPVHHNMDNNDSHFGDDHPSSGLDNVHHHEFGQPDMKYDEVRPPIHNGNEDDLGPNGNGHPSHIDYNSERFFDDVFLQISPDYGCLV